MKDIPIIEIKYFCNEPNKLRESIEDRLSIIGGKQGFGISNALANIYFYDFSTDGTAIVLIPRGIQNANLKNIDEQKSIAESGAVHLLNFTNKPFYNQVLRALKDLQDYKF